MSDPLHPNSKATGVNKAYEQAAFMDDTEEMDCRLRDLPNKHIE